MNRAARRAAVARRLVAPDGGPGEEIVRMQREVDRYADSVRNAHQESARQLELLAVRIEEQIELGVIDIDYVLEALRFLAADHKKQGRG